MLTTIYRAAQQLAKLAKSLEGGNAVHAPSVNLISKLGVSCLVRLRREQADEAVDQMF